MVLHRPSEPAAVTRKVRPSTPDTRFVIFTEALVGDNFLVPANPDMSVGHAHDVRPK